MFNKYLNLSVKALIISLILFLFSNIIYATENNVPKVISRGLHAYKTKNIEAAIAIWIKDSPLKYSNYATNETAKLNQIKAFYGKYIDFDVIKSVELTDKTKLHYLVMNYEKSPLFAKFLCYKIKDNWIISSLSFSKSAQSILTQQILSGE